MSAAWRSALALLTFSGSLFAQSYTAPAGIRQAVRRTGASILPGGRVIAVKLALALGETSWLYPASILIGTCLLAGLSMAGERPC